jgi:hypothetical protein
MKDLKLVPVDELHSSIRTFIVDSDTIIGDYEDMKSLILTMIKAGYMFNMDRDRLRDAMEDLTFMMCPDDDANKDRVERGLEYEEDSDCDSDMDDMESYLKPAELATKYGKERLERQVNQGNDVVEDIGDAKDLD